jgi:hypothetical protein
MNKIIFKNKYITRLEGLPQKETGTSLQNIRNLLTFLRESKFSR